MIRISIAALIAFSAAAEAQQPSNLTIMCGPYAPLADMLGDKHGERLLHTGETAAGHEMQQWLNYEGGSWSIVLRDGEIGCLVATGNGFNVTPAKAKGEAS